jgi:molybdate transport system ATP-binding protein
MKNNLLFEFQNATYEIDAGRNFININWQARIGETWAVYGAGGAGKTALCSIFQSPRYVREGKLKLHFMDGKPEDSVYREVVTVSFSQIHWGGSYYQQRYTPSQITGIPTVAQYLHLDEACNPMANELLATFHLAEFKDSACIKLSNGQMRKLLIVEALLKMPTLLILDNPFTGLDMESRKILNDKLALLVSRGQNIIFLINHWRDMPDCVTHVLELEKFKIMGMNPKASFGNYSAASCGIVYPALQDNSTLKLRCTSFPKLGSHYPLLRRIVQLTHSATLRFRNESFTIKRTVPKVEFLSGNLKPESFSATIAYPELLPPIDHHYELAVKLYNVTIEYEGKRILDNVNWRVRKGDKWALVGGNGSGKSTLLSLLTADNTHAYNKDVYLFDRLRGSGETIWDIKEQIGFLSPEFHLYFTKALTCAQVVTSGFSDTMLPKAHLSEKESRSLQSFFAYFSLSDLSDRYFQRISQTEQRLVLLIRALIKNAEMLILDEPYHFFDEPLIRHANRLLDWYCRDKTFIFVTHHEEEIPTCIDQMMQMNAGVGKIISIP